ncbi:Facilitated trehalose transporter Tret1-2-like protein [Cryptotermes secundus]|uniref:Facilitated trehalose transporter Tret1-2-like protein n=1 Tax=Cryptotermes secundus TaxID=105785 RepID=A0A2J7Q086_9NEOP|nr:facilitated trehalose transporter Tret1-2 homolog isoform X2 [Cryptotermes secundus]PNF21989.1 Facilitated trehalose transporter Tret1-2-like protein [Cryptotermes secundus]
MPPPPTYAFRLYSIAFLKQLLLAMAASLGYMTTGLVRGFSSPGIPSMQQKAPHLVPNESAVSWLSSVPPSGAFVGSLCAGPLMQWVGRRRTLMLSSPLWVLGWCLIALAQTYEMILLARILTGFCVGLVTPSVAVYVSECSYAGIRGVLGSLPALFMAGGILISYLMGAWLPWDQLAWASAGFPALLLVVMIPLPESPAWLLSRGHTADADKSLKWLHHQPHTPKENIPVELKEMPVFTSESTQHQVSSNENSRSGFSIKELFHLPILIPFSLTFTLLIFQQISGIDAIIFYTVSIFHSAGSQINDHLATVLVGLVQLLANILSLFLIDRAGRRPLLIASGAIMCVALAALGTHFHLQKHGMAEGLGLLPLISLMIFMIGFSIGYCSIPFLLMGELIPEKQRSFLSSVAGSLNLGIMFIVIKTYHDLKNSVGEAGAFWLYSTLCLCSCFFVYFLVPETKGRSLKEIEEFFELSQIPKKSNDRNNMEEKHASEQNTTDTAIEVTTKTTSTHGRTNVTATTIQQNKRTTVHED